MVPVSIFRLLCFPPVLRAPRGHAGRWANELRRHSFLRNPFGRLVEFDSRRHDVGQGGTAVSGHDRWSKPAARPINAPTAWVYSAGTGRAVRPAAASASQHTLGATAAADRSSPIWRRPVVRVAFPAASATAVYATGFYLSNTPSTAFRARRHGRLPSVRSGLPSARRCHVMALQELQLAQHHHRRPVHVAIIYYTRNRAFRSTLIDFLG